MKKIALIGVENSHAPAFANLIKNNPEKYGDIEIVGVYSYDGAAAQKMVDDGLAPMAANTSSYFLGKVDGVINTARHGDNHYEYSMPYIKAGVPMFIDKPFCIAPHNAKEMITEARNAGTLLCGGSCLKFAPELATLKMKSLLVFLGMYCLHPCPHLLTCQIHMEISTSTPDIWLRCFCLCLDFLYPYMLLPVRKLSLYYVVILI